MPWQRVNPEIDEKMRGLCCNPYPNHPKGCPNFGKKEACPPKYPIIQELIDLSPESPVYIIWTSFDIGAHVNRMRELHPKWTERQLYCCLYWQPRARKALKREVSVFLKEHPDMFIVVTPEGAGVNITATMAKVGVQLEWPPKNVTYQVVMAGRKDDKHAKVG